MKKEDWIYMPHPGHFMCARHCRFFLNTCVGDYIVSTVGEYIPDAFGGIGNDRMADCGEKVDFEEIGHKRKYETMVFKAQKSEHECCPFEMVSGDSLDFEGYNDSGEAFRGHVKMCEKWSSDIENSYKQV